MTTPPHDSAFEKYALLGAYHWKTIRPNILHHHPFTAERYRRAIRAAGDAINGHVLDYGSGDGALLSWICRRTPYAYGFDPAPGASELATRMLARAGQSATFFDDPNAIPSAKFDAVICADVIEHVYDVPGLLTTIARVMKPTGIAVVTTPIRLLEHPPDPNHVQEWFPDEFIALFENGPLRVLYSEQFVPLAAAEAYYWRPLRIPVLRLICNLMSIAGKDALTSLGFPPRNMIAQLVAARVA